MKKWICLLMIAAMLLSLVACGTAPSEEQEPVENETVQTQPEKEETKADAPEQKEEDTQEENAEVEKETEQTEETEETVEQLPAVDLSAVRDDIINKLSVQNPLKIETPALNNLYGIGADLVAQSASFVTMSGTFPDEIILVEAVDEAAAETIRSCLQKRLEEVLVQSETYDAENHAAALECQVVVNGLYVSLILSPKQAEMCEIVQSYF